MATPYPIEIIGEQNFGERQDGRSNEQTKYVLTQGECVVPKLSVTEPASGALKLLSQFIPIR
jgi:hypothetical protein